MFKCLKSLLNCFLSWNVSLSVALFKCDMPTWWHSHRRICRRRTNHLLPTNTRSLTPTSPANSKIPKIYHFPILSHILSYFPCLPAHSNRIHVQYIYPYIYPKNHLNLGLIYHTSLKPHSWDFFCCFRIMSSPATQKKRSSHIFSTCNIFRIFWTAIWFGAFPLIASVSCAALPPCTRKAASQ